jgi:hypothetical protein
MIPGGAQISYKKMFRILIGPPLFVNPTEAHKVLLRALPEKQRARLRK